MLFEYVVIILTCDEGLCSNYAVLVCWPAGKMSYEKMLRIVK